MQIDEHPVLGKHTKSVKAGSDDRSRMAGSIASNQAGKPPKSHSATGKELTFQLELSHRRFTVVRSTTTHNFQQSLKQFHPIKGKQALNKLILKCCG